MADSRFFQSEGPQTLANLAALAGASLGDGVDGDTEIRDVAPLETAGPGDISFLDNRRYIPAFQASQAEACIVEQSFVEKAPAGMSLLVSDNPYRSYALVARAFYPSGRVEAGVHETAVIDPSAKIGDGTRIGPYAVIADGVEIGAGCNIGPHVVIESGVSIGEGTKIGSGASLSHCMIGRECQIHAGARIGNRGFGFTLDPEGYLDVPQLGRVIVGDRVEVGANSTIDRGAGPDTVIGDGARIDNLIQLGHNVQIGKGCVLVAQSGVAGSSKLGDYVMVGAQGGIAGHLNIGSGAQIAAQSGVMRDVPAGLKVCGAPAIPIKEFFRLVSIWHKQIRAPRKSDE